MKKVLIADDSKLVASIIKKKIESDSQFEVQTVETLAAAKEILEQKEHNVFISLVGLYLPDAPSGEIVDYMILKNVPTIVFTGEVSDTIREQIWSKKVIDYMLKESGSNVDYVINLIKRIDKNKDIKVLVVDDSLIYRTKIADLLKVHQYRVYQAAGGVEALRIVNDNPDIKMVIADYNMPDMNGLELVREIRGHFSKEDMAIIGMSGDNLLSAKFIKLGANDFFSKDFFTEEFYCRITQNIELLEHILDIKESSNMDYLTGIYNRRYFYETGQKLFENSKRQNLTITVAMLDIDYFKRINDAYGHACGDQVLKKVARILHNRFRASDIVSRVGGEEFCVLAVNMKNENIETIFENIRKGMEIAEMRTEKGIFKITVSIGVCSTMTGSLEEMVKCADHLLYQAKEAGRNRVMCD